MQNKVGKKNYEMGQMHRDIHGKSLGKGVKKYSEVRLKLLLLSFERTFY